MAGETVLQLLEITVAVAAFFWGVYETRERRKMARVLRTITKTYPGDIAKIYQSTEWARTNSRDAIAVVAKLPESEAKKDLIKFTSNCIGDSTATSRMCVNLFNGLLGFQEAQFGTRNFTHPEKKVLRLCQDEMESQKDPDKKE